jgi:hypothetical protein
MQHAAPFSAPSPAHGRCTPETASSKKLVGVRRRGGLVCSPAPHAPGATRKQLILAVRPRQDQGETNRQPLLRRLL